MVILLLLPWARGCGVTITPDGGLDGGMMLSLSAPAKLTPRATLDDFVTICGRPEAMPPARLTSVSGAMCARLTKAGDMLPVEPCPAIGGVELPALRAVFDPSPDAPKPAVPPARKNELRLLAHDEPREPEPPEFCVPYEDASHAADGDLRGAFACGVGGAFRLSLWVCRRWGELLVREGRTGLMLK